MGVREKIASGIIDIYEKAKAVNLCNKPFEISMPTVNVHVEDEGAVEE
jgi:hypothetical protein